jgi:hypothetical protein
MSSCTWGQYAKVLITYIVLVGGKYWRGSVFDIFINMLKLFTLWKPDWLYETMPHIYLVTGFAVISHLDTPAGIGSGALLLISALLIWKMRKTNRSL